MPPISETNSTPKSSTNSPMPGRPWSAKASRKSATTRSASPAKACSGSIRSSPGSSNPNTAASATLELSSMPTAKPKTLEECASPQEALIELCLPFVADRSQVRTQCTQVPPEQIPEPFHWLLVHRNHMTKVLEAQYGRPMDLDVIKHQLDDEFYTRKIILRPQGHDTIVEVGGVRLNFRFITPEIRREILDRHTP